MSEPQRKAVQMKNPAAVALGRRGGLKGGKARMALLSPEERSSLASKAATAKAAKQSPEEKSAAGRKAVLARWKKSNRKGR
jgi:hypothetical protein